MMRLRSIAAAAGSIALTGAFAFAPAGGQSSSTTAATPSPQATASPSSEPKTLPADAFTLGDLTAADVIPAPTAAADAWTPPAGYAVYARSGPEIPPTSFQAATLTIE